MGKAPDLILRVDEVQHRAFLIALNEHGIAFNGNELRITPGTLVGIEVECAREPDSSMTRSMQNNLIKNQAAGLTTIIFAVMPKSVKRAAEYLQQCGENLDGVYVIDALQLLDALRKESHG